MYPHSFILLAIIMHFPRKSELLKQWLWVATPLGDEILITEIYRSCIVSFQGYDFSIDLLLLELIDLDVILSMDWLSANYVLLDCH